MNFSAPPSNHRKNNRLDPVLYHGNRAYFITIAAAQRRQVFVTNPLVSYHLDALNRMATKWYFDVIAYCYMPDHVHLLVVGKVKKSDLVAFVKGYKQVTGYSYKQQTGNTLWQKSFYDHVLRKDEAIHEIVLYILANPVRKQMVESPSAYPYAGSLVYGQAIFKM